jgi:hypothetical protein
MAEADGRKRLERMTHLLGTDHFNEPSTPAVKLDGVTPPAPPSLSTPPGPAITPEITVQTATSAPDVKVEATSVESGAKPVEPAVPPSRGAKRSTKTPPPEESSDPAPEAPSAPSPADTPRLKATKIVDDQFHIEHVYESPEVTPPKKGKRQSSPLPAPPSTAAATPEVAMPPAGEEMESVPTEVPVSPLASVDARSEEIPAVPVLATVVAPVTAVVHHSNHNGGENHPKVPWSVKVPLDMYDFIREHDNYRPFLKDQRPFREKFLEWVTTMRSDVSQQLEVARDAAVKARERQATVSAQPGKTPESAREETL